MFPKQPNRTEMKVPSIFKFISLASALLACVSPLAATEATRPAQPNFLLMLADDLGWQDVKVYDTVEPYSVYETPYMDQLAVDGLRFTNAYSPSPVCAPSRVAIMSGKHPGRTDVTSVSGGKCPKAGSVNSQSITPHYRSSLKDEEYSLAEALRDKGYFTGVFGKWHMSPDGHNSTFPLPTDQGFDRAYNGRGVQSGMDRLTGFATNAPSDPYQLDANGIAKDPVTVEALDFLAEAAAGTDPFFCYYSTWLVHGPWQMRTESLLQKYAGRMGYTYPLDGSEIFAEGQNNPYYAAMVESLDYYINQLITYLEDTDDPRWPGHKLIENTYVVLTSDNGGMENGDPQGLVTDNYPLDQGKIWIKEGGTRVPFIVRGPGIAANAVSDVVVNGLDLYPTFMALTGEATLSQNLEGCDLSDLWLQAPQDAGQVLHHQTSAVRDSMFWHFPHSGRVATTLVKDGWKLYKNYDYLWNDAAAQPYSLYQLYDSNGAPVDEGEMTDLINAQTAVANAMIPELEIWIEEVDARPMYLNPQKGTLPLSDQSLTILGSDHDDTVAWVSWNTDRAQLKYLDLLYTKSATADGNEEWFKLTVPFTHSQGWAEVAIPDGAQSFFFTLVDENNFFVSSVDLTGHSGYDSEVVPLYSWLPTNSASLTDIGTTYPTGDVLWGNTVNGAEVAIRDAIENAQVILEDSFSINTLTKDGVLNQNSTGWHAGSGWGLGTGNGWLYNTNVNAGSTSDGALAQIVDLAGKGLTNESQLHLEFDFVSWDGANASDDIYVHVWGLVDNSASGTASIANLGAQNGNMWANAVTNGFSVTNLGDGSLMSAGGDGVASGAAIQLLDQDTGNSLLANAIHVRRTFDLSAYAVNTLAGYDYLVIGFSRNPVAGDNKFALFDVAVSVTAEPNTSLVGQTFTVAEPSSLSALSLQASQSTTVGSTDAAELYLWVGRYASGAPVNELFRTQVYEKIDMRDVGLTAGHYYTIDFEDSVLLPGTYAFQLKWKESGTDNDSLWARANGAGEYASGDLLHVITSAASSPDLPFVQSESLGSDLVFALHGSVDYFGGWAAANALDRIPEALFLDGLGSAVTKDNQSYSKGGSSAWTVTQSGLSNASSTNNTVGEGAIAKCIDLTDLEASAAAQLTLSFDYSTADASEKLYVHLWGCVDLDPSQNSGIMNLGAQSGNAWVSVAPEIMEVYNLAKSDGVFTGASGTAADAAAILTGSTGAQTYSATFDLSTFTTAPDVISDYDYLVLGFAREVGGTTNPAVTITNIRLSIDGGDVLHEFPTLSMLPTHVDADPDGDGYSNLFEYALGGNPNLGNDVGVLPNMNTAVDGIDFVYQRRRDAATHGIRYDIETTESLTLPGSWEIVSLEDDGIDIVDAEFETVTHRLDASGKAHEFIRLSIGEL